MTSESDEQYPEGKLNDEDEGVLAMGIAVETETVIVRFPKPVAWFGLPGEQAIILGQTLIKRGREALNNVPKG